MALSLQELGQKIKQQHPQYADMDDKELADKVLAKYPQYADMVEKPGAFSRAASTIGSILKPLATGVEKVKGATDWLLNKTNLPEIAGGAVGTAGSVIGGAIGAVGTPISNIAQDKPLFQDFKKNVRETAESTSQFGQEIGAEGLREAPYAGLGKVPSALEVLPLAVSGIDDLKEGNYKDLAWKMPLAALGVFGSVKSKGLLLNEPVFGRTKSLPLDVRTQKVLTETVDKAIKPSGAKVSSEAQKKAYVRDTETAFRTILEIEPKFKNEITGDIETRLPKTRADVRDAVGQGKAAVFNKYNTLKVQAGETGARVDFNPIADELEKAAKSLDIKLNNPKLASELNNMASDYRKVGSATLEDSQGIIEGINSRSDAYYKNPNASDSSKIASEQLISNNIRQQLDDSIENLTGGQYQELRNLYKSLKTIESDVARQAKVEAGKSKGGIIDMVDIYSSHQLVDYLSNSGSATGLVKATVSQVLKARYNYLKNPNRFIKKTFELLQEDLDSGGKKVIPKTPPKVKPAGLLGPGAIPLESGVKSKLLTQEEIAARK